MKKHIINFLLICLMLLNFSIAYAKMIEGDDGLYYRDGNPNLLVIDNGNRFYTVADLKSAWLDFRSQGNIIVVFNSYTISFESEDIIYRNTDMLIEEIKTGTVYFNGYVWCQKYETEYSYKQRRQAYAKLKNAAQNNR